MQRVSPSCALFDWASSVASSVAVGDEVAPILAGGTCASVPGLSLGRLAVLPSSIFHTGRERLSAFVDLCRMWSAVTRATGIAVP